MMNRLMRGRPAFVLALLFVFRADPATAQELAIDLSQEPAAAQTVQIPVAGRAMPIAILKSAALKGAALRIAVTPFLAATGEPLVPLLSKDVATTAQREIEVAAGPQELVTVFLIVPQLSGPGPFSGSLFVFADAQPAQSVRYRQPLSVAASPPSRPATLRMLPEGDTRAIEVTPFSRRYEPPAKYDTKLGPTVDIHLSDAGDRWPLNVSPGEPTYTKVPESLNFSDHSAFYDATTGARLTPPFKVSPEGTTIKMQLGGLAAGEYNMTIPFAGSNASNEPRKFALVITARHNISYALLCLIVALLLSFTASKSVSIRTERDKLRNRIAELRPFWLQSESATMAVVWVQSIVAQAHQLCDRTLLPSLDTVHSRLDTAAELLLAIDRLRRVRVEIKQTVLPPFASARAFKLAERIGDRLDPAMGKADLTDIHAAITELRGWTRQNEWQARYTADLATSITQLLAVVDPDVIQDLAHRAKIEPLVAVLKTKLPTEQSELERRERVYAAVKIAWERKDAAEFPELLSVLDKGIDQILRKADDTAWKRLKSDGKSSFELISHRNGQPVEAFDPLIFRFTAGTQALDKTFLVMHGLTFAWKFTVTSKATGRVVELKPFTRGPQVPVFAPFAGVMKPELKLIYRDTGAELDVTHTNVTVEKSTQFVALKGFSLGEGLQLLLAFIIAAITGLEQFYFKSAGFGSLPDYMALFAWGATVDQAKNLLQRTAAPAAPTPATQPPATVPATVPTATPPSPPPPSPPGAGAVAAKPAAPGAGDGKKPAAARGGQSGASPAADAKGKPKVPLPVIPRPDRPATLPLGQAKKPE